MTEQPEDAGRRGVARPGRRDVLRGVAVVGAFLAVDLGALLYANKWIGPARLTPGVFLDGFAKVFGRHPGFRKNHAKGVAVTGFFDSNGNGRALSTASVFANWFMRSRTSLESSELFISRTATAATRITTMTIGGTTRSLRQCS